MNRKSLPEKMLVAVFKHRFLVVCIVFYVALAFILLEAKPRSGSAIDWPRLSRLLQGRDDGFFVPGSQFQVFKPSLPKNGTVSFLQDRPFSSYDLMIEHLYAAQAFLAPIVINPQPKEKIAIVYCSNREIANERMRREGYKLLFSIADGKGLAVKST